MPSSSVRDIAIGIALLMGAAIAYGFVAAPEGAAGDLLSNPWGQVAVVDLYLALVPAWLWVAWREATTAARVGWGVAMVVLGSLGLALYVALAAHRADGVPSLLLGRHAPVG